MNSFSLHQVHLVNFNRKYGDIGEAIKHSDGLAVVGVFIRVRKARDHFCYLFIIIIIIIIIIAIIIFYLFCFCCCLFYILYLVSSDGVSTGLTSHIYIYVVRKIEGAGYRIYDPWMVSLAHKGSNPRKKSYFNKHVPSLVKLEFFSVFFFFFCCVFVFHPVHASR